MAAIAPRVAAIAPWFRLRPPSCGPGLESQALHLRFKKTNRYNYFHYQVDVMKHFWRISRESKAETTTTRRGHIAFSYKHFCTLCLKRPKINEKEAGVGPFKKTFLYTSA